VLPPVTNATLFVNLNSLLFIQSKDRIMLVDEIKTKLGVPEIMVRIRPP